VASALRSVPGVVEVQIDWQKGQGKVSHGETVQVEELLRAVERASESSVHWFRARVAESR
jgi:copper chaperone CopZ